MRGRPVLRDRRRPQRVRQQRARGEGDVFVAEADESDRSFLLLAPFGAVVTNVEADHLDNYGDLAAVEAAFDRFLETVDPQGFVVVCADDPGAARLRDVPAPAGMHRARLRTYGTSADADLHLTGLEVGPDATSYTATLDGKELGRVRIQVPGEHMALNSAAALLAGIELGLPVADLVEGWVASAGCTDGSSSRAPSPGCACTTTTPTTRPR
ncbi:Mur ligase family protein [Blastococcus brunescens]|uniref:Mur ligase family protein n=1 Tax=Blastococcus brunescens TaxID=1564165 RepID=A0ABZ1B828_9ACTN|nr:Mur ligase family protein [Blastococcus sp. BMG 8361]WRL66941.1 Mur ligase family protein [Blastococcus sp. BMG 8361]